MHLNSFYICSSITECNCFMGKLYVVPTPVGNLEDMTFRAIRVLKEADLILAEDTRTSGILLKHFEIKNAMQSHHKFNEHKTVEGIVNRQKKGRVTRLTSLQEEKRTMIFYESPYRLVKTLTQFAEFFGAERPVSVCREISKIHEESVRGTLTEVIAHFTQNEPRGEIVIVLGGKED